MLTVFVIILFLLCGASWLVFIFFHKHVEYRISVFVEMVGEENQRIFRLKTAHFLRIVYFISILLLTSAMGVSFVKIFL